VKDPIKIANKIKEKEEKWRDEAGLSPDFGKIISIALVNGKVEHVFSGDNEKEILAETWGVLEMWREICGFNSKAFDLPWILRRSWYCNVEPTNSYDLFPYRTVSHYDLRLILNHGNKTASGKLSMFAKLKLGIDIEGTGSEMQDMYDLGKWDEIRSHNLSDTRTTWELFKTMGRWYL